MNVPGKAMAVLPASGTDELPLEHELSDGRYRITEVKRPTDSGFNYLAETPDGVTVSVREFYLSDICLRIDNQVEFNAKSDRALFRKLVDGFINDARYLLSLDNPHIALVSDVFEENGTAYMISEPPAGKSLERLLTDGRSFKPVEVARIANHLFRALIEIHAFGMLHRDVCPRNIIITPKGDAVLLADFSTFREDKSKVSKVVSSVLRAQSVHAPLEFVFEGSEQNEASDVFSAASVIYMLVRGEAAVSCQDRLSAVAKSDPDPYVPLEGSEDRYDRRLLVTLDMGLALLNENRVRSASEFMTCFAKNMLADDFLKLQSEAARRRPEDRTLFSGVRGFFRSFFGKR